MLWRAKMRHWKCTTVFPVSIFLLIGTTWFLGQQPPAPEKKPLVETPSMRLATAKNVFITRTHGSKIPFEVISSTLEGWGRYTVVNEPEKADLLIEISSTGDSGVQVSSSSKVSSDSGQEEKSTST